MSEERYLNNTNIRIWKKNAKQFFYLKSIDNNDFYFLSYGMGASTYRWICRYEDNNALAGAIGIKNTSMILSDRYFNDYSFYINQYKEVFELAKKYLTLI